MGLTFRLLNADEIDARVSTVSEKGCSLLLYKDARCDQNLLDETVGPTNWQRDHKLIGDRLYCTVSIWDQDKEQWICKSDVGTESYTEKEKGQASDSFKRACFNWGLGRELYTAPFIWIPAGECKVQETNGRWTTRDSFRVSAIGYDDKRRINALEIVKIDKWKGDDKVVFQWGAVLHNSDLGKPRKKAAQKKTAKPEPKEEPKTDMPLATLQERKTLYDLCQSVYVDYNKLLEKVGCTDPKKLTQAQRAEALNILKNTNGS